MTALRVFLLVAWAVTAYLVVIATLELGVAALVAAALANVPSDRALPLDRLVSQCRQRKSVLLAAWPQRDHATIIDVVRRSGIAIRILDSIASGRRQGETEQALDQLGDETMREVLYLFYRRTMQTYERCVRKWRVPEDVQARGGLSA